MPKILPLLFAGFVLISTAQAQSVGTCPQSLGEAYLDVNNVRARILNNGGLFYRGEPHVYNVPKDSPSNAIFATNIWIGGFVGTETTPRFAGSMYGPWEYWAGPLDDSGNPPLDCTEYDRLYSVYRADIEAYETTGAITNDLRDWPTGLGAPTLAPPNNGVDDDADGEIDEADEELAFDISVSLAERKDRVIDLSAGERPAILGDQMVWWVMNDLGNEHERSGAPAIGVEVHGAAFAFKQVLRTGDGTVLPNGPIGEATFYRYRLYFRNNLPLERAYLGIKVDPDLGDFADDYVGSDSTLGLGYVYNADNSDISGEGYGTPPPAVGFDFFQGPMVPSPGDSARLAGRRIPDFKNLPMTTFGGTFKSGQCGDPGDAWGFYYQMDARCRDGRQHTYGGNGVDEEGGGSSIPTRFLFSGDPATNTGWTEFNPDPFTNSVAPISPGDRRFLVATGPFTINPGDFQEVVFGIVFARGTDNLESVAALRRADQSVQALFDSNFQRVSPPGAPVVTATATNGEVVLEWINPPSSNNYLNAYEAFDPLALSDPGTPVSERSYRFEGYDILQFADEVDQTGEIIATYDLVNGVTRIVEGLPNELNEELARGTDSGIQHFHRLQNLVNYRTYHFGVRPYAYNATSFPRILRGDIARVTITPARLQDDVSDAAIEAAEDLAEPDLLGIPNSPLTEGRIWADIVSPGRVQEAMYTVEFYAIEVPDADVSMDEEDVVDPAPFVTAKTARATTITYDIKRDGTVVFNGSTTGQPAPFREDVAVIDGLRFSVLVSDFGIKAFGTVANSAGPIDPPDMAAFAFNFSGFPTLVEAGITPDGAYAFNDRPNEGVQQALSNSKWGFHAGGAASINYGPASESTFLGRATRSGTLVENLSFFDYEMRFTQECTDAIDRIIETTDCLAWRGFDDGAFVEVPFALWRVGIATFEDPGDDVRLIPAICEEACGAGTDSLTYDIGSDHPISGGDNDPFTDWVYWHLPEDGGATPGEQGYRDFFFGGAGTGGEVLARTVLVNFNGGTLPTVNAPLPEVGTTFRIYTNKRPVPGDVFTIDTRGFGVTEGTTDFEAIGVVPNPYIGASIYERTRASDEVRFTNLPELATIRVFTLHGALIKTIRKNSAERFITWNLRTENDLPIGSGVYLIHVEMPGVGSQTLKFAVVKKQVTPSGVLDTQ